jgi:hypothetical protein
MDNKLFIVYWPVALHVFFRLKPADKGSFRMHFIFLSGMAVLKNRYG